MRQHRDGNDDLDLSDDEDRRRVTGRGRGANAVVGRTVVGMVSYDTNHGVCASGAFRCLARVTKDRTRSGGLEAVVDGRNCTGCRTTTQNGDVTSSDLPSYSQAFRKT